MSGRSRRCLVAATAAVALLAAACGGGESSGLPTLVDTATTASSDPEDIEPVPEPTAVTEPSSEAAGTAELLSPAKAAVADIEADQTVGAVDAADPEAITDEEPSESDIAGKELAEAGMAGEKSGETTGEEPIQREGLTDEERLLAFAECMRRNGVDFPDPVVEADGAVTFGFLPGSDGGGPAAFREIDRDPDLPAARDTCQGLVEGLAFGPGQGGFDLIEVQDTLLEFARCMRDNGIDIGDPDMSAFAPGANNDDGPVGPFGTTVMEIEIGDADFAAVFEVCQQQLPGGRQGARSGGGG